MAQWKGKTRGGLTGYKIFLAVLRYLGLPFAYFLLRFVALYYFFFAPASFRHIFRFYYRSLNFGFSRSVISVYQNYYCFGQVILDKFVTMGGMSARFTFDFEGEEYLHELVRTGSGGLLISAHIGNFEMAGHMLNRLGTKVNVVMLDAEHQKIKDLVSSFAQKSFHIIAIGQDNNHIFEISKALENHEIVCLHGDRFMPGSKTQTFRFLGHEARFPTGPFYLAVKFGIPVSFVFAMKDSRCHYHFYATPPRTYRCPSLSAEKDALVKSLISEYVSAFEAKVGQYPLQWFNYFDFWRT